MARSHQIEVQRPLAPVEGSGGYFRSLVAKPPAVSSGSQPRVVPRLLAALVTVLGAVGVHMMWEFFVNTAVGQRIDRAAFEGAAAFEQGRLWQVAEPVLNVVSYALVIGGAVVAVLIAVLRRRVLLAIQMFVLVGAANLTTQLVKYWYPRPSLSPGWAGYSNSLPSGHTTVAASVSAAMLLAAPRRWRPLVAVLGAGWTIVMGLSTMVGRWHRPADVVAAVFVVVAWAAVICAITSARTLDRPDGEASDEFRLGYPGGSHRLFNPAAAVGVVPRASWLVASFLALLGGICTLIWIFVIFRLLDANPDMSSYYVTAYGGGAAGVVGVTLLCFAMLLVLRQATGAPAPPPS